MKIKFILSLLAISVIVGSCCGDCPLNPTKDLKLECQVRSATINEFNPGLQRQDTVLVPVPEYSIASFQFPADKNNSGFLPNDERFTGDSVIAVRELQYSSNPNLFIAVYDTYPSNDNIAGDFLVSAVNLAGNTAELRFRGYLQRFNQTFKSEDATKYCQFLQNNTDALKQALADVKLYGNGVSGSRDASSYTVKDIVIYDGKGNKYALGDPNVVQPSQTYIDQLLADSQNSGIAVTVQPGDVFVYRAVNGKSFAFVVVDINQGTFEPRKKRVSIMFNSLD